MKTHSVIVAIQPKHYDLEISQFFNVARSFVHKVRRELEASDGNVENVAKHRKHKSCSDTIRTPQFVQQLRTLLMKTIQVHKGHIERSSKVSQNTICRIVHKDIHYKSYEMR